MNAGVDSDELQIEIVTSHYRDRRLKTIRRRVPYTSKY